jgi:hypothetical protein
MRRRNPGMSCSSVKCRMSYIRRVFPPIYLPGMRPVWSILIRIGKTYLIRSAIQLEASLYTVFRRLIGLQFFNIPGFLLLIDFEKAFDSISWMFIESFSYISLTSVSPLNNVRSYSKLLSLQKVQHISVMFEEMRPKTLGIPSSINDVSSAYWDITYSVSSIVIPLISLLCRKINIDKTKVVWIGKKKYSLDTMCVNWGLEWGSTRFTLLGLHFSVNIDEIEKL